MSDKLVNGGLEAGGQNTKQPAEFYVSGLFCVFGIVLLDLY